MMDMSAKFIPSTSVGLGFGLGPPPKPPPKLISPTKPSEQPEIAVRCPVCGGESTGYHYGVESCESCKGFFRRSVQRKKDYVCIKDGKCEVNLATRRSCAACRFKKCCKIGMNISDEEPSSKVYLECVSSYAAYFGTDKKSRAELGADLALSVHTPYTLGSHHNPNLNHIPKAPFTVNSSGLPFFSQCVIKWALQLSTFRDLSVSCQMKCLLNNWASLSLVEILKKSSEAKDRLILGTNQILDANYKIINLKNPPKYISNHMHSYSNSDSQESEGASPLLTSISDVYQKFLSMKLDNRELAFLYAASLFSSGLNFYLHETRDSTKIANHQVDVLYEMEKYISKKPSSTQPNCPNLQSPMDMDRFSTVSIFMCDMERLISDYLGQSEGNASLELNKLIHPTPTYDAVQGFCAANNFM